MKRDMQKMASDLIDSTIALIARDGFDKASTRNIAGACGLRDAYIYQAFKSKEELFAEAFRREDASMSAEVRRNIPILSEKAFSMRERHRIFFGNFWKYLMGHPESSLFYVQYYYSPYYPKNSAEAHNKLWSPIMKDMMVSFVSEAEGYAVLRLWLNILMCLAVKTLYGGLETDKSTEEFYFELLYSVIGPKIAEEC